MPARRTSCWREAARGLFPIRGAAWDATRWTRGWLLGIGSAVIDRALDIGPGNTNNPADKVTQGDLRIVGEALDKAGKPRPA
jgi:hypothetical protein